MGKINIVIPMLGAGERFKSKTSLPKPLITVNNKTFIEHSVNSLGIDGRYIFITKIYKNNEYNKQFKKLLKQICLDYIQIKTDAETNGPAESCLIALEHINLDDPLIITNCDQVMEWNPDLFLKEIKDKDPDAALVLFKSTNTKHSFAKIKNNSIVQIKEKVVISDNALVGIHYWKHASLFVESAQKLIKDFKQKNIKETYISETYNYLIDDNKNILPYFINKDEYHSLGTPEDVNEYKRWIGNK